MMSGLRTMRLCLGSKHDIYIGELNMAIGRRSRSAASRSAANLANPSLRSEGQFRVGAGTLSVAWSNR